MRLANCIFTSKTVGDALPSLSTATANTTATVPVTAAGAAAAMPSKIGFLIDFDYAGVMQPTRRYPIGFTANLPDARRHWKARQQLPMRFGHDWFSLASMFDFFRPTDTASIEAWQEAINHVNSGAHEAALSILDPMADETLLMIVDPFPDHPWWNKQT